MGGSGDGVHVHGFWVLWKWVLGLKKTGYVFYVDGLKKTIIAAKVHLLATMAIHFLLWVWLILILILILTQTQIKTLENLGLKRKESDRERGWEMLGVKELRRWVRVNRQWWREREDDKEARGLCVMKKLQRWRERDERPWREKELIFTHKILIYLLPLSYSAILHSKSHRSTLFFFFFFFAIVTFYNFYWSGHFGLEW